MSRSMIDERRSSNEVEPGARTPPTEPAKSVSPVKHSWPSTTSASMPALWPGVWMASMRMSPDSTTAPSRSSASTPPIDSASSGCARTGMP